MKQILDSWLQEAHETEYGVPIWVCIKDNPLHVRVGQILYYYYFLNNVMDDFYTLGRHIPFVDFYRNIDCFRKPTKEEIKRCKNLLLNDDLTSAERRKAYRIDN